jgi:hypothetical protein
MTDTYILANQDCTSCKNAGSSSRYLNGGKPYGDNIFNIVDSFDVNTAQVEATNFFGYSIAEFGELVYKSNGEKITLQKIEFSNLDALYVSKSGEKWRLGIS